MHAAGWAGGIDHAGGQSVQQVHGGQHDQAGGDGGPDRGCRQLECGEQHRGDYDDPDDDHDDHDDYDDFDDYDDQ